ncbi:prepilin-type N-terminal cleavage/methylation domain-containing protein [Oceanimonas baumannii]|uniref:PilW family protein n=1 Tax=Oceanimonas baumannii TaxID=129578 RepID=UPI001D182959|nr:prepilin-type N-terminal cleavage/methylation domain-containing protein [Oceanimonas baumannii]MCC4265709.1 prepilin-type N-terminal cleavage/methylation domain-containing protein [Oceanimonas baumannii]
MRMTSEQCGMTLVEMLVSLVAGLLVVAGALSLVSSVMVSGNTTLMLSRLNQDAQATMDIMVRDIQRTGYHFDAAKDMAMGPPVSGASSAEYVFSTTDDLYAASGVVPDCIRVKYAESPATSVSRVYSYDGSEERLEVLNDVSVSAALSTLCGSGGALMAKQEISVDDLRFELVSGSSASGMRTIKLSLSASHINRPALSVSLQREIKLRNDGY